jgi:hypothetical protein
MTNSAGVDAVKALSDNELTRLITQLERDEQAVSRRRTQLHNRIDFLRSGGFASAEPGEEPLDQLLAEDREISAQRLDLHCRMDALVAERSRRRGH